jgi:hypothetical protein
MVLEDLGESVAGKLKSLIRVEDLRRSVSAQGFLDGLIAEVRIRGIGKTPRQDFAAVPVHARHQVHEPTGHGYVSDIGSPNLMGRFGVDRLDAHQAHQPLDMFSVDRAALPSKMPNHRPAAVGWCFLNGFDAGRGQKPASKPALSYLAALTLSSVFPSISSIPAGIVGNQCILAITLGGKLLLKLSATLGSMFFAVPASLDAVLYLVMLLSAAAFSGLRQKLIHL